MPYGLDQGSLNVITPSTNNQLWYGSAGAANGTIARLNVTYQYPAVALDQSIYISSVSCSGNTLTATFNNTGVYQYAAPLWKKASGLVFITAAPTCDGSDGQNAFLMSSTVTCDDSARTCTSSGTFKDLGDIFSSLDADWGSVTVTPTATDSSSDSTNTTATCGAAPSANISGLPAAGCGTTFDHTIDEALGYYTGDDDTILAQIAPGPSSGSGSGSGGMKKRGTDSDGVKKAKAAAGPSIKSGAESDATAVSGAIKGGVKGTATSFGTEAKKIAKAIISFVQSSYNLVKFVVAGDYKQSLDVNLAMSAPSSIMTASKWNNNQQAVRFYHFSVDSTDPGYSIWQNALEMSARDFSGLMTPYPGIDMWCVGCGVQGDIQAIGHLSASSSGISHAQVSFNGSLYADMYLGIDAFATIKRSYNKTILHKDLATFKIPKVLTLGPSLEVGISAMEHTEYVGQVLTGASLNWPSISSTIDFIDGSQTDVSGFTPSLNASLQSAKSTKLTASLKMPVQLTFGRKFTLIHISNSKS